MNLDAVRLRDAVLCIDCECITASVRGQCTVCAGRSLMSLARLLGGTIEGEETAKILAMAPDMENVIRELVESAA